MRSAVSTTLYVLRYNRYKYQCCCRKPLVHLVYTRRPRIKFRGIVASAKTTKLITPRNFLRLQYENWAWLLMDNLSSIFVLCSYNLTEKHSMKMVSSSILWGMWLCIIQAPNDQNTVIVHSGCSIVTTVWSEPDNIAKTRDPMQNPAWSDSILLTGSDLPGMNKMWPEWRSSSLIHMV